MRKPIWLYISILALALAGCAPAEPVQTTAVPVTEAVTETTVPETEPSREGVENLTTIVTEKDIHLLDKYPDLKEVDLSGSECYSAILVYIQTHPDIQVTYTVDFGGAVGDNRTEALELEGIVFDKLLENLKFLPGVQSLHLPKTHLTREEMDTLKEAYPEIEITYTVDILGREMTVDTETIDLAGMTSEQITQMVPALMLLPNLTNVELMDASGACALSRADVKQLVDVAPGVSFHYVFELFGQTISTTDEKVRFNNLRLKESDEPALREALAIMTGCEKFVLNRCGLSNEKMAEIRDDYTNTELIWDVYFGKDGRYGYFTNTDTVRAVYNVTDSTCYNLRYLRHVKYIDMGHNDTLTDVSWTAFMPDLEILILSGASMTSLEGLGSCKKLEWLELANCYKLNDLSALSGCEGLKYLNICYTKVSDLQPLDGCPMELLFCKQTKVDAEEQQTFREIHPECQATFTGKDPYAGPGWRYIDNGHTFSEPYKKIRKVFDLDAVDKRIAEQEGK